MKILSDGPSGHLRLSVLSLFLISATLQSSGQMKDSPVTKISYPNIPKFSISSFAIYQKSLHLGYERVLNKNHSIYVFGGYNEFPKILNLNLTNTKITGTQNKTGYSFDI